MESKNTARLDDDVQSARQENIVTGVNGFTSSMNKLLYKQARQNGNVIFSPINIYSALALLHMGADGKSREKIADVMKLPKDNDGIERIHSAIGETLKALENTTKTTAYSEADGWHEQETTIIKVANGIFVQKDIDLTPSYEAQVQVHYESAISKVDFNNEPSKATDIINEFVSENTNKRIPKIFDDPVPRETQAVLTSCLYFKANWQEVFSESCTEDAPFDTGTENKIVKMMSNREYVPYANLADLQLEAVSLPYKGGDASMFFILPYASATTQPLHNLISSTLSGGNLRRVIDETKSTAYVHYKVPHMKFKWSEDIRDRLTQIGVNEIFTGRANFKNMLAGDRLHISKIVHAAEIEVDEKGNEASAVTASMMVYCCAMRPPPQPKQFYLNRPFLMFVYHHKSRTILFMAAVHNPTAT